jgi:hypothetical protein
MFLSELARAIATRSQSCSGRESLWTVNRYDVDVDTKIQLFMFAMTGIR